MRLILAGIILTAVPVGASAASWAQIPNQKGTFVDLSSIRRDSFPKATAGVVTYENESPVLATYKAAWLKSGEVEVEVIFDCGGNFAVLQQVVPNGDAPNARYRSFNHTRSFRESGVQLSSIPRNTMYEKAQAMVCRAEE